MSPSITRFAPQVVFLAIVVYLCWPSLQRFASKTANLPEQTKKAATMAEFTVASLSPTFPPPPTRNPFGPPGPMSLAKKNRTDRRSVKELAEKAAADAKDSGLVLKATCIVGEQRLALINDRVYREKEVIKGQGEEPVNWVVTDILPHKVLLSCQGMPLQLTYSNTASKASGSSKSAAGKGAKKPTK
jgi:hypothetical protein